jgi:sugar O-acyltransferase (sialic acid O-acetyltransferase NeuD family)
MLIKNVIIGYSGHAFVVLDILRSNGIVAAAYCEKEEKTNNPFGLIYLGEERSTTTISELKFYNAYLGIGNNSIRREIYQFFSERNINMPSVIHSNAIVSTNVLIENGSVIMPGVVINSFAKIGKAVICNTSSTIEHECEIGDFAHIAPGAVLAGGVKVGANSFIGANSVVKEGVNIGENVIVGAGSVVIHDIPDHKKIVGNPTRFI